VVRKGVDEPPVSFFRTAATRDTAIPYLELGLDNSDETVGANTYGHDGRVDGTRGAINNSRLFVDPASGTLFLYDLHPFAPRLNLPFDRAADSALFRRARLHGPPDSANAANSAIYDKYVLQRSLDARYYIDLEFTAQRAVGEINLGRSNIVEGSDVVTVNGVQIQRDRDYTIDYDLGKVTMKKQLGPTDQLAINYSYAPLFQQAGRTLIGGTIGWRSRRAWAERSCPKARARRTCVRGSAKSLRAA
jgi:cell surface protein SprA